MKRSSFAHYSREELGESLQTVSDAAASIIPTKNPDISVSEWAESQRVIPHGLSPFPGPFSYDMFPFMREIADCFSSRSPVREIALMKGTQIGATVTIENMIGYTIDVDPAPCAYITADAELSELRMGIHIDALINSSGLEGKVNSQHRRKGQRKTGDVKNRKEFLGGYLLALGPKSDSKLRSNPLQRIFVDEVDTFNQALKGEGDTIELIRRRVDAFLSISKIAWLSSPKTEHDSHILRLYREGDQRKYMVPCKSCGTFQFLKWGQFKWTENERGGLLYKRDDAGEIVESSVYYECERCREPWVNEDKNVFLPKGRWEPTAEPLRGLMQSYHLPGYYSPVGFRAWEDAVSEYLLIKRESYPPLKLQNFVNTYHGETYKLKETIKPSLDRIVERERPYYANERPAIADPIFVTIGADVQGDRIECEIVAWGRDAVSYSIDYRVFTGDTEDWNRSPAFLQLQDCILSEHWGMVPVLTAVDAGFRSSQVYEFCASFEQGVLPVMGGFRGYRNNKEFAFRDAPGQNVMRVDVNDDLLKQIFYDWVGRRKFEDGGLPMGYCHFPANYDVEHFKRLTAESREFVDTGSGKRWRWDSGSRRNEQLDCRVYAMAMVYVLRDHIQQTYNLEALPWDDFWKIIEVEVNGG